MVRNRCYAESTPNATLLFLYPCRRTPEHA